MKFNTNYNIKFDHAAFLNGVIHWDSVDLGSLYFDVESESLMEIPMPKPRRRYSGYRYFESSGGYLHLAVGRRPQDYLVFRIYEMLENHSNWFFKYRIDLQAELYRIDDWDMLWFVFHYDEDEGDTAIAMMDGRLMLKYNLDYQGLIMSQELRRAASGYQYDHDRFRGCLYFETLAFV